MTAVCFIEVLFCRSEFASLCDFDFSPNAFCNPSVPIFWGSVWSESCLVGLVWCLDHRFSSFPCSVLVPSISDPATSGLGSPDSAFQTLQFASGIAGLQFKRWGDFYLATSFGFENLCAYYSAGFAFNPTCPSVLPRFAPGRCPQVFDRSVGQVHLLTHRRWTLFAKQVVVQRISILQIADPSFCSWKFIAMRNPHRKFEIPICHFFLLMRKIALHQNRFSSKNHKKTTPWFADANGSQNRVFSLKCGAWYKDFGLETPKAKNKN